MLKMSTKYKTGYKTLYIVWFQNFVGKLYIGVHIFKIWKEMYPNVNSDYL